jgi:hypothetical protein
MRKLLLMLSFCFTGCDDGGGGPPVDSPLRGTLFINEVMPKNDTACPDEAEAFKDWIEIYNAGSSNVDLSGLAISDNPDKLDKVLLPDGLTVPAGGVLLLWADGDGGAPDRLPFKLSATAETLTLSDAELRIIDEVNWENAAGDVSLARFPDGGELTLCPRSTCGVLNGATCN